MIFELKDNFSIDTDAEVKKYNKDDIIIEEGARSMFFYYLLSGEVNVFNMTKDGKVFLHHKVQDKNFFGEPAAILDIPFQGYINVTSDEAEVMRVTREKLMEYLIDNPEFCVKFLQSVAEKSLKKSELLERVVFLNPEDRIIKHFEDFKKGSEEKMLIDLTRKELSTMTGLRIETVIRTIKRMEKKEKLEIINGKVFY